MGSWGHTGPLLGVQIVDVTPELIEHLGGAGDGVLVSRVLPGTPAEGAGIRVGDLIVGVNGERIESASDIREALDDAWDQVVAVEVVRDGRTQRIDVAFPEKDKDEPTGPRA
jgi:serine protease Do